MISSKNKFYFIHKGKFYWCDRELYMVRIIKEPGYRVLTKDFHCMGVTIPAGFKWNGASSPNTPFASWVCRKFFKSLVSSCFHDYMCGLATCDKDREKADEGFFILKKYVELESSWKCDVGFVGVRIGAFAGIGSSYK